MIRSKAFGRTATTADTKTQIGSTYTLPAGTRKLVGLLVGINKDTITDEGGAVIVSIETDFSSGPFEFVVSNDSIGATSGVSAPTEAKFIPLDIDVPGAGQISVYANAPTAVEMAVAVMFQ